MNKLELASPVAAGVSLSSAETDSVVTAVYSTITDALAAGEPVTIAGFGTFGTRTRSARQGRNPRTGETIAIPASNATSFKAGKALRDAVRYPTRRSTFDRQTVPVQHGPCKGTNEGSNSTTPPSNNTVYVSLKGDIPTTGYISFSRRKQCL